MNILWLDEKIQFFCEGNYAIWVLNSFNYKSLANSIDFVIYELVINEINIHDIAFSPCC